MQSTPPRRQYFKYRRDENESIDEIVHKRIKKRLDSLNQRYFDEKNAQGYRHGRRWNIDINSENASELVSSTAETIVHTIDVINHKTSIISTQIKEASDQLHSEISKYLFKLVHETTEESGNTVNASEHEGDFPSAFLAMLKKIRFGVDRFGRPSPPTMYVSPSTGPSMIQKLEAQPSAFKEKIDRLILEREKEATADEVKRISRFRWTPV